MNRYVFTPFLWTENGSIHLIIYIITWIIYILQGVVSGIYFHFWKKIPMRCQPSRLCIKTIAISTFPTTIKITRIPTVKILINNNPSPANHWNSNTPKTKIQIIDKRTPKHPNIHQFCLYLYHLCPYCSERWRLTYIIYIWIKRKPYLKK